MITQTWCVTRLYGSNEGTELAPARELNVRVGVEDGTDHYMLSLDERIFQLSGADLAELGSMIQSIMATSEDVASPTPKRPRK